LSDPNSIRVEEGGRSVGFFCKALPAKVDSHVLSQLKGAAERYAGKNVRLCLHSDPESTFHTMIVLDRKGTYYPPHKHEQKGECWHLIEGSMAVFVFDEAGNIIDVERLDPDGVFMYRIEVGMYHTVVALSETIVYHESKLGPFLGQGDSIVPSWAPEGTNRMEAERFMAFLREKLEAAG